MMGYFFKLEGRLGGKTKVSSYLPLLPVWWLDIRFILRSGFITEVYYACVCIIADVTVGFDWAKFDLKDKTTL